MPILEKYGIIELNNNWIWGELILIITVFVPAYFWAFCSYFKKYTALRSIFQIVVMIEVFVIGIPFIMQSYGIIEKFQFHLAPYLFQFLLIIAFPALVAVHDLVKKGKGTPFPYDPTEHLVRTGVYAYIKNPIQWSFTLMFIPISFYYDSYYFLLGSLISIAYTYGISNFQEYEDMKKRFGKEWIEYKNSVPSWRFLWKPINIPYGEIYFDDDCNQCSQIKKWFQSSKSTKLHIKSKSEYPKDQILQVTYIDHNGLEYKGVRAIACAMEHINLAYASLAWFMRMPIINQVLQIIIDTMGVGNTIERCELS
jgi:protein-S-isoprenylcysteine O-methyltransferase Ste14